MGKTNKVKGDEFEEFLVKLFRGIGDAPRKTKGSGAIRVEPDIVTPYATIEAKKTDSASFRVTDEVMDDLERKSAIYDGLRILAVATAGRKQFVLDIGDFIIMYKAYLESVKDKGITEAEKPKV